MAALDFLAGLADLAGFALAEVAFFADADSVEPAFFAAVALVLLALRLEVLLRGDRVAISGRPGCGR